MFSIYIFQHFELSFWGQEGVLCVYTCVHVCVFVCMYVYVCTGVFQIQISPYPAQTHMADFSLDKSEHFVYCIHEIVVGSIVQIKVLLYIIII